MASWDVGTWKCCSQCTLWHTSIVAKVTHNTCKYNNMWQGILEVDCTEDHLECSSGWNALKALVYISIDPMDFDLLPLFHQWKNMPE